MHRIVAILIAVAAFTLAATLVGAAQPAATKAPAATTPGTTGGSPASAVATSTASAPAEDAPKPDADGFIPLLSGKDLKGWKADDELKKHWAVDGDVLKSDGTGDLWTDKPYTDFILKVEWRMKAKSFGAIYLRGVPKMAVGITSIDAGSGELTNYRRDMKLALELRNACAPKRKADARVGDWNSFIITCRGDAVSVTLNRQLVIPAVHLPALSPTGPIALHGFPNMPMEYRNILIRELKDTDEKPAN